MAREPVIANGLSFMLDALTSATRLQVDVYDKVAIHGSSCLASSSSSAAVAAACRINTSTHPADPRPASYVGS